MQEEIKTMKERNVWTLVPKKENDKVLGCRWVYTTKQDANGRVERYKARLVAQGFRQIRGMTFDEVFSPVVNFSIIRLMFSVLVCLNKWKHVQCDIKCAYLYAPLRERILMQQPPGFEIDLGKVCLLNKAVYGLKQSGREWYFELHKTLNSLGFEKLNWCNCAYTFKQNVALILYVDDMVIFGSDSEKIEYVLSLLRKDFDIKVLGKTRKLLGVEFREKDYKVRIHQQTYIEKLCESYEKYFFSISSLPIAKGAIYSKNQSPKTQQEIDEMSKYPYRSLIGSLAFLANRTRPDIMYAVNIFSQYQENPGIAHWLGLLKLLGYVKATSHFQLDISKIENMDIIAYSDADYATNKDDRTSMGGQILFIDSSPVAWRTFKIKCICLSSMESEFVALTETAKELIWLKRVTDECIKQLKIKGNSNLCTLFGDNQASLDFVKSPIENYKTKHIDIRLFFIRDLVYKKLFQLRYIQSKLNLADVFTKAACKYRLKQFNDKVFLPTN